jgi:3',5'-cyclic AMP phosphodiesterase CpdA
MKNALVLLLPVGLLAAACSQESEAKLAADGTGDTSYVLSDAQRVSPDAELIAACGSGELTSSSGSRLRRRPYLQQVTDHSALVMFTTAPSEPVHVDVGEPDSPAVQSAVAEVDGAGQSVASLTGREADQIYCYSLQGLTEPAGFRTAPRSGTGRTVRFLAFGDSGGGNGAQHALLDQMYTVPFDLIIHTGDIAYDDGTLGEYESNVFGVYAGLFRSFPFYPTSGNHDYNTARAAAFRQVFALPRNGVPAADERWYSFDWGDVHFVALDTEQMGASQASWLEADLERNELPWVVAYAHRPPYSSGEHGSSALFRKTFGPALEQHQVKLVLNGHDHDYERTTPINGVTYVVTGGGGESTRSVGKSSFTAFSEDVTHFVYVEVAADTLTLHAIDAVGREFDSTRITL